MSDRKLQLQVMLSAVDKITAPLKNIQAASRRLAAATKDTRREIKSLESQAAKVEALQKLQNSVRQSTERLRQSSSALQRMGQAYRNTKEPSRDFTAALNKQTREHQKLVTEQRNEIGKLTQLRHEMQENGIATKDLANTQTLLSQKTRLTNDLMAKQELQLKRSSDMMRQYQKAKEVRNNLAIKGGFMMAGGGAAMAAMMPSINEQSMYQQQVDQFRALGVDNKTINNAKAFADNLHILGNSITDNMETLKEAHAVLRHYDEAKAVTPELLQMKFATNFLSSRGLSEDSAHTLRDQAPAVLKIAELRNQINTPEQFKQSVNMSTQAFAASGGMVKPEDYLEFIKTGGEAAKNLSPEAFYFGYSHIIQQLGADRTGSALASLNSGWIGKHIDERAKDALAAIGLVDPKSVTYSKTGHVKDFKLVNQAAFQADTPAYLMKEVLPRIEKKYPNLDENGIRNIITSLTSNHKAQDLLALMYREHSNIEKQVAAGHQAYGVDQLINLGKNNPAGKRIILAKQADDLKKQIGADIMPAYVKGLTAIASLLQKINGEITRHPRAAKYLIEGIAGVAALTLTLGGLAVAVASLLGPFAALRYAFGMMSGGRAAARDIRLIKAALNELNGVESVAKKMGILTRAFRMVRLAVVSFGESMWALMANPIIAAIAIAIAALGLAAYEMWKHWDVVKPALLKFWKDICDAVSGAWDYLKKKWDNMMSWFEGLPARLKNIGSEIIDGFLSGIDEKSQAVGNAVKKIKDMLPSWMHSDDSDSEVNVSAKPAGKIPSMGGWNPIIPRQAMPVAAYGPAAPTIVHVHPSPGMNEQTLGQKVARAIDKSQRQQQASQRSRLSDID